MKVCVITVTYNGQDRILNCLKSVSNQSYKDITHLIVDGDSNDNTKEVVNNFDSSKKLVFISQKDKSLWDAMNKGITYAIDNGFDVLTFLNDDDFFCNDNHISDSVILFNSSGCSVVTAPINVISTENLTINIKRKCPAFPLSFSNLSRGLMPPHPGSMYSVLLYKKYGLLVDNHKLISPDFDFFCRLVSNGVYESRLSSVSVSMSDQGISNSDLTFIFTRLFRQNRSINYYFGSSSLLKLLFFKFYKLFKGY